MNVIKQFHAQLKMKFILLINVEMTTMFGILTFLRMINVTFEGLKARKDFIFQQFSFYMQLKYHAQLKVENEKKFYNLVT